MKKTLLATAMMTGFLSVSALAEDGKINFIGAITDDACTVVNNVSSPLNVTLGTISSSAFNGAGSTAAQTKFTLALSNCPATVTSSQVKFDGIADANVSSILALTQEAGVATGVGIQLVDNKNVVIPLYTASSAYPLQAGVNSFDFAARYYATDNTVTAGPANATSNFTIIYN
ncbi:MULTISPECIES: fimbrial protein [unclassified Serratia (in: enterobacteria)]|uniref:fimbrial protein n=1 Tax=unclassified Serratia (in: enterobacteria) TaxID=2647522 RepID=UPI0030761828